MRFSFVLGGLAAIGLFVACGSDTSDVGANPGDGAGQSAGGAAGTQGGAQAGGEQGGAGQSAGGVSGSGQNQGGIANGQGGAGSGQGGAGSGQGGAGSGQGGAGMAGFSVVGSNRPRADGSKVSDMDRATVADDNNAFTFDLYGKLKDTTPGKNVFFSPLSLSLGLGMTTAGAKGATLTELSKGMHFSLPQTALHPALNSLSLALGAYPQKAKDTAKKLGLAGDPEVRLDLVNAMWGDQTISWQNDFLDILAQDYGTGVNQADFIHDWDKERLTINQWVTEQTEQRIQDLLPPLSLDTSTRFVLVNAIDLTFPWADPFDPQSTHQAPFTPEGGAAQQVTTMHTTVGNNFAEDDLAQYAALDLFDRTLSLNLYVPKAGKLAEFEAALATEVSSLRAAAKYAALDLSLPKFKYTAPDSTDLVEIFQSLGVKTPFQMGQADFSRMTTDTNLFITHIFHKASLGFDEGGVQAAAASGITGSAGGGGGPVLQDFHVDRSFFVDVRDNKTGAILFFGRIVDPSQM
jgi:serpin B